jgi:ubiquinone/menaquinone biosynthesis C-methylase UbiE
LTLSLPNELMSTSTRECATEGGRHHQNARPDSTRTGGRLRRNTQAGLRWIDIGCGNGAFTEMIVERCSPATVNGIDPSEAQLAFARARRGAQMAMFQPGDAMALPFPDKTFLMQL